MTVDYKNYFYKPKSLKICRTCYVYATNAIFTFKNIFWNGSSLHETICGVERWKCEVGATCPEETGHCCSEGRKPTLSRMHCTLPDLWTLLQMGDVLQDVPGFFWNRKRLPAGHEQCHITAKQTHFWQEIDNDQDQGSYLIRTALPSYLKELWTKLILQCNQSSLSLGLHGPGTISQPVTGCLAVTNYLVRSESHYSILEGESADYSLCVGGCGRTKNAEQQSVVDTAALKWGCSGCRRKWGDVDCSAAAYTDTVVIQSWLEIPV